jgi:thymidylate synthase (FAD)
MIETLKLKKFPVLNDGFVCLVDVMGDDHTIVEAARNSYGDGTTHVSKDRTLIRYLMRHRHTTPFEMVELKFNIRVPMDCWRQWIRHRTANVNEYSTRYSLVIDSAQETKPKEWRVQAEDNRQGSDGQIDELAGTILSSEELKFHRHANEVYLGRIRQGIAREQARKDIPLCTYTEATWKIDLHNLLHFLTLRMDDHAQLEIRKYAEIIGHEIIKPLFPLTWEAFEDYRLGAIQLTRLDIEMINTLEAFRSKTIGAKITEEHFLDQQHTQWKELERCRERDECFEKLVRLGIITIKS